MDGFVHLTRSMLISAGIRRQDIYCNRAVELPGWFRAEKQWDLLVVSDGQLLAAAEFKSQVGSFGNNFNNRSEEAIGNASDILAAYREGAFKPSAKPWLGYLWLGYLMLIEEAAGSIRPIAVEEPHFILFPEFVDASYVKRYEILLTKLIRERLYDSACLLSSASNSGRRGIYQQPSLELAFETFAKSLVARVSTLTKL